MTTYQNKTIYQAAPTFPELGDGFADVVEAADFPQHILRWRNNRSAAKIGLADLSDADWIAHFGRFQPLADNLPKPLAQRYHGHQFRTYNPDIGDGRGFLFAQMRDQQGRLMDLGTKGSGTTPYSRRGDGRLTLKGGVRELMASEMLWALGANTSDTFSLIETGEALERYDEPSPTRGAVMVRLTHGHIRIGTFQRHAYYSDHEKIEQLVDYCMTHYFNQQTQGSAADKALAFLAEVVKTSAQNAADLMAAGYVHGVLNSDNINITGEIFDFGPFRLLPTMNLNFTAAYFDETGLYSYGRQPDAVLWDVYQLGGALADIADEDALRDVLEPWGQHYVAALQAKLLKRLGVVSKSTTEDAAMLKRVNDYMIAEEAPFERFFFDWYGGEISANRAQQSPEWRQYKKDKYADMRAALQSYQPSRPSALTHAYFQQSAPCTMLIDEVENLWAHIADNDNWQPLYDKMDAIADMAAALGNAD